MFLRPLVRLRPRRLRGLGTTKNRKRQRLAFASQSSRNGVAAERTSDQRMSGSKGTRVSISITVTDPYKRVNDAQNTSLPQATITEDLLVFLYLAEMAHRYLLYSIRGWALDILCFYVSQLGCSEHALAVYERVLFVAVLANHARLHQAVINRIYDALIYSPPRSLDTARIEKFVVQLNLLMLEPAMAYRKAMDARPAERFPSALRQVNIALRKKCIKGKIGIEEGLEAMEALETLNKSFY